MGVGDLQNPTPEGATPLDEDEAQDLIPTHILTISQLNEWEQTNILQAEEWLFARRRPQLLSEPFVRDLHRRMFSETWKWAGKYRQTGKNIGVPSSQIASKVRDTCEDVAFWNANGVFPMDEAAIRLHHRLVAIHPFANGNGRHTRLMADALLFNHDMSRFTWGSQNLQAPGNTRSQYLRALRQADEGDYSALLAFARS
jgi:Fic-DOC domain mobile mystery protein B